MLDILARLNSRLPYFGMWSFHKIQGVCLRCWRCTRKSFLKWRWWRVYVSVVLLGARNVLFKVIIFHRYTTASRGTLGELVWNVYDSQVDYPIIHYQ